MNKFKFLAMVLLLGIAGSVSAAPFVDNNQTPPAGNTAEPINVSAAGQNKLGNLGVFSFLAAGDVVFSNPSGTSDGAPGVGKVLTSDANGKATWQTPTGGGFWEAATGGIRYNGGHVSIASGNPLRLFSPTNNGYASISMHNDGVHANYPWFFENNVSVTAGKELRLYNSGNTGWATISMAPDGVHANYPWFFANDVSVTDGKALKLYNPGNTGWATIGMNAAGIVNANYPWSFTNKIYTPEFCLNGVCRTSWPGGSGSGSGDVSGSGSGVADKLVKWTGANTVGVSGITDSATEVNLRKNLVLDSANGVDKVVIQNDNGRGSIELISQGLGNTPYIDFKRSAGDDNDMRISIDANDGDRLIISPGADPSQKVYIGKHPDPNLNGLGSVVAADTVIAKNIIFENSLGVRSYTTDGLVGGAVVLAAMGLAMATYGATAGVVAIIAGFALSDARLKDNIQPLSPVIERLAEINPVTYEWNDEYKKLYKQQTGKEAPETGTQIGLIAQDMEKVFPELVTTGPDGYKAINYQQFTAVLLKATQEQQEKIDDLEKEINEIHASLKKLKNK